jgi:hypothetical protein
MAHDIHFDRISTDGGHDLSGSLTGTLAGSLERGEHE